MPNQLETEIVKGAVQAQRDYQRMSGGLWLSHGPEHFLTSLVAKSLSTGHGWEVFPEASPKKIKEWQKDKPKGRPGTIQSKRFDIVVWQKSGDRLRAVIEIKRAYAYMDALAIDRKKIADFLRPQKHAVAGYLLIYNEVQNDKPQRMRDRIDGWAKKLNCDIVDTHIDKQIDEDGWRWAVTLFRLNS